MLEKGQFDAIYHEHYSYFSLASLSRILSDHGFTITDATFPTAQGGSLRVVAKHSAANVKPLTIDEHITMKEYESFVKRVGHFRRDFRVLLYKHKGSKIVGFGAPAKSVTLLNFCDIEKNLFSYIVDSTSVKHGRVLPGLHIPIVNESAIKDHPADAIVILAWNYQGEILQKLTQLVGKKTAVIIPFPKLKRTCIV